MDEQISIGDRSVVIRRRGVRLSSTGLHRFSSARTRLEHTEREAHVRQRFTLERCAQRARVGLRTLTRCLSGERVDRRSADLIFRGVDLELGADDLRTI